MTSGPVHDSEMRSLDRARMYSIFAPLDANEPLPREQLQAARRHRTLGRWELAGALWLPMLFLILLVGGWLKPPPIFVLAAIALTFFGLLGYALAGSGYFSRSRLPSPRLPSPRPSPALREREESGTGNNSNHD